MNKSLRINDLFASDRALTRLILTSGSAPYLLTQALPLIAEVANSESVYLVFINSVSDISDSVDLDSKVDFSQATSS